ncbi:MAG: carbohydrate-binding domain-containing protein [Clostridia bacterium]|nr:carbohydrate-binding domain-containing protein [Clostridia bacterium]
MKRVKGLAAGAALLLLLTACNGAPKEQPTGETEITLSDQRITVDGKPIATEPQGAVYAANDIVYYEADKDFTYGEGTADDAHDAQTAAAHTVVHITEAGTYRLSGKLSRGQIAVDLGEEAKENPAAVVTLLLDGADITCEVAPAVIFYNVYECGDAENGTKDVDTAAAGANVILADGSQNRINGSYVAKIYKPDSVTLNDEGTAVEEAKKLHKYDGAFYSKMSMNVDGGEKDTGILDIYAENEGLDSELHLTVNGGNINIYSGNDGINTNEDGVSVTTVNGGRVNIRVTGETGEGDGIDSNGWLVINGGTVMTAACSDSADAGIDSDMGIHINGGTVMAAGHMLDRIEDGGQTYAVFTFAQKQSGTDTVTLKKETGEAVMTYQPQNAYTILIYSSADLKAGTYTLWSGDTPLAGQSGGIMGGHGMRPDGMTPPETDGETPPEGWERPDGEAPPEDWERPDGETPPEDWERPDGETPPEKPDRPHNGAQVPGEEGGMLQEKTTEFVISDGANQFGGITPAE